MRCAPDTRARTSRRSFPDGVHRPGEPSPAKGSQAKRPSGRRSPSRALVVEELGTFVFLWPPLAAFNSRAGMARFRRKTLELAEPWLASRKNTKGT